MMRWNNRLFPYPLLAGWLDDYTGRDFQATLNAVLSNSRKINLGIQFECGSDFLKGLIEREKAQYALVVSCPATAAREVIPSPLATTICELNAGDYSKELASVPYIVAVEDLSGFASDEHADEFREALPDGFSIPKGGILAAGVTIRTTLVTETDAESVIDLVANDQVPNGEIRVNLANERIRIELARDDKARVEMLRKKSAYGREMAMLFSSLYLPTVAEAIGKLNETDYAESRWAVVMRNALRKNGINAEGDDLAENAFAHAQKILNAPIGKALTAFADQED